MHVTYCVSEHYINCIGGGGIQIKKTKEYIEKKYNINITIATKSSEIPNDTNIIHLFEANDLSNKMEFINKGKDIGAKIVMSTIYWDLTYFTPYMIFGPILGYYVNPIFINFEVLISKVLSKLIKRPKYFSERVIKNTSDVIANIDILLPNSIEEGELLLKYCKRYPMDMSKIVPIVNAVEINDNSEAFDISLPPNYILQAGRIEPAKNQLGTITALYKTTFPIVFLGKDYHPESRYSRKLHKIAKKRGNVFFIDSVPYEKMNIYYKKALVHILPSFKESPGLVSLEALYNGCHTVVSDSRFCPVESYFKDYVTTINPLSKKSIYNGILKEISIKRDFNHIKEVILQNYIWDKTAEQTYEVYKKLYNQ